MPVPYPLLLLKELKRKELRWVRSQPRNLARVKLFEGRPETRQVKSIRPLYHLLSCDRSHDKSRGSRQQRLGQVILMLLFTPSEIPSRSEGGVGIDLSLAPPPLQLEKGIKHIAGHRRASYVCCYTPETSWVVEITTLIRDLFVPYLLF